MLKVGDTVRYLNAVGGGRVVKIQGDLAYVDEDGFETPVLVRECVVVGTASAAPAKAAGSTAKQSAPAPKEKVSVAPTVLPVIETASGNKLNLVLGFEATDIKALSRSTFEAYLVNDSNYFVFITIAARATQAAEWKLFYNGVIEPNIQEFLFEIEPSQLVDFDRLQVQYIAYKRDKEYEAKAPAAIELKVDTTKFAKLHCFRPNPYFDNPVIAFDIVCDDRAMVPQTLDAKHLTEGLQRKATDTAPAKKHDSKPNQRHNDVIEVDLHASELFESTDGLEPADILNYQLDRFTEVMKANLGKPGQKIVFIHGKGEGVLRQALMKELTHRFKGHDVQDASFQEYGYGATQVTIRHIEATQRPQKPRRR